MMGGGGACAALVPFPDESIAGQGRLQRPKSPGLEISMGCLRRPGAPIIYGIKMVMGGGGACATRISQALMIS